MPHIPTLPYFTLQVVLFVHNYFSGHAFRHTCDRILVRSHLSLGGGHWSRWGETDKRCHIHDIMVMVLICVKGTARDEICCQRIESEGQGGHDRARQTAIFADSDEHCNVMF